MDASSDNAHEIDSNKGLRALYATAQTLTELGSLDEVLQAIVTEAYPLVDADIVYITVFDQEGQLVRAATGAISTGFRHARIPVGLGLAGRIQTSMAPAWTSDYETDDSFERTEILDARMAREAVKALLGVPMIYRRELVGVLFMGNRTPKSFSPDEIALFSALASHASVSVHNARMYQASQDALQELMQTKNELEATTSALQQATRVHNSLTSSVLNGGDLDSVLRQLAEWMPGNGMLFDEDGELVAGTAPEPSIMEELTRSGADGPKPRPERRALNDGLHALEVDVIAGGTRLGRLVHLGTDPVAQEHEQTLERCSQVVAMLLLQRIAVRAASQQALVELTAEILRTSGRISPETVERANDRGIPLESFDMSMAVSVGEMSASSVLRTLRSRLPSTDGIFDKRPGHIIGLFRTTHHDQSTVAIDRALRIALGDSPAWCTGAFDIREPVDSQLHSTIAAVRVAVAIGMHGSPIDQTLLLPYASLIDPRRSKDLADFVTAHLGAIMRHDQQTGASLLTTMVRYFEKNRHVKATSAALFIHPNTLVKRLQRIDELMNGADWREGQTSVLVGLACQLHALVAAEQS